MCYSLLHYYYSILHLRAYIHARVPNHKVHHEVHVAIGYYIRLQVAQKYHVITSKKITQLTFNTIFKVRLIKIKRFIMKEEMENVRKI